MARPEKVAVVDEIRAKLDGADAAVLTEYRGLTVSRAGHAARRPPARRHRVQGLQEHAGPPGAPRRRASPTGRRCSSGPTAIAFVKGDAVIAAKALRDFGRDHPTLVVKGGLLGDRAADRRPTSRRWPTSSRARCCSPAWPAASRPRWSRRPACSGVHPQLGVRRQGATSTSGSRAARLPAEPEARSPRQPTPRATVEPTRRRAPGRGPAAASDATRRGLDAEASRPSRCGTGRSRSNRSRSTRDRHPSRSEHAETWEN